MTLGVEEEFQVVDLRSGDLVPRAELLLPPARAALGGAVELELNLCQIEVGTPVCTTLDEVRTHLTALRHGLASAAVQVGTGVVAVGTHPFGMWQDQQVDLGRERYRRMADVYGIVAHQQTICGCHVHVGIADRDLAIATMNRTRPWLPVLLALTANSPYWQGLDTGYASYRLQVWQRWPTSGMPPQLPSAAEFDRMVARLQSIEAIEDPTFLYWYVRPSARFPTLEFRASDVCLRVEDAVTLAGLIRALAWTCMRDAVEGRIDASPPLEELDAAMWRAARYGLGSTLVSPSAPTVRPASEVAAEMLAYLAEGLEEHGDGVTVGAGVEAILRRGNGASFQREVRTRRDDPRDVVAAALAATAAGSIEVAAR
ncbi:MAG: glutamate---cysteine ligase / carboxylate-amine ligase [Actinomycetota bacterium]|jgi:carboxylate-amine ligase|nr:glutamate---cysteine ligase / carboxylate-amine ligase [Actinomycetota bacterium]MEA2842365.1 glutamate---cysteine ligase / carboxylate-amine ligase [Actinomycetota bacterium]